jgi:hypothetical protein
MLESSDGTCYAEGDPYSSEFKLQSKFSIAQSRTQGQFRLKQGGALWRRDFISYGDGFRVRVYSTRTQISRGIVHIGGAQSVGCSPSHIAASLVIHVEARGGASSSLSLRTPLAAENEGMITVRWS